MRRGVKEAIIAVAALPVLLATGVYVGGRIGDGGSTALQPAAGRVRTPAPLVTVKPATPAPLVTVKPATPAPVVTVKPATPAPLVTVKPAKPVPSPVVTVRPPAVVPPPPASAPPAGAPPRAAGPVAPAAPPPAPDVVLGRGSASGDVRAWQRQMARRGWRLAVDGVFGPQTRSVARRFQREKGLHVDGLVGRETWDAAWRRPVTP